MSATLAIAILGAVTGVAGLLWQVVSFGLAGRRLELVAIHKRLTEAPSDDRFLIILGAPMWELEVFASNIGRLDATIIGIAVWVDRPVGWPLRVRYRAAAWRALGRRRKWAPLVTFPPSVEMFAPSRIEYEDTLLELPALVKAGETFVFPRIAVGGQVDFDPDQVRLAVRLGSGQVVRARPVSDALLRPFQIEPAS
jgi:hypothetical protein